MKIIIDEFIESLKAKQASNNTIVSYERDIMKLRKLWINRVLKKRVFGKKAWIYGLFSQKQP